MAASAKKKKVVKTAMTNVSRQVNFNFILGMGRLKKAKTTPNVDETSLDPCNVDGTSLESETILVVHCWSQARYDAVNLLLDPYMISMVHHWNRKRYQWYIFGAELGTMSMVHCWNHIECRWCIVGFGDNVHDTSLEPSQRPCQ